MSQHGKSHSKQPDKIGSDPRAGKKLGGQTDFGVAQDDRIEREYASQATRSQDKGRAVERSGTDNERVSGVGSAHSGPGSGSGGDLDTDIVGVGTDGRGVAASGKIHEPSGPDDTDGTSKAFASGPPKPRNRKTPQTSTQVKGTTFDRSGGDVSTTGAGQGAASVSSPNGDDAAAGEISNDEASGGDNSPSDR